MAFEPRINTSIEISFSASETILEIDLTLKAQGRV